MPHLRESMRIRLHAALRRRFGKHWGKNPSARCKHDGLIGKYSGNAEIFSKIESKIIKASIIRFFMLL